MTEQQELERDRADEGSGRPRQAQRASRLAGDRRIGPTALVALVALIGLAIWLVIDSTGGDESTSESGTAPVALSAAGLRDVARSAQQPIYWVGRQSGVRYEFTRNSRGVFVRYLPEGVEVGDAKPLLTVATYPVQNAYAVTKSGSGPNTVTRAIADGGVATYHRSRPRSVYVAYPGSASQVEVFAPRGATARRLATSGRVRPVLGVEQATTSLARGPEAVTPAELRAHATSLGHPIYWAGPRPNTTYELWQTTRGYTYIRYLPRGVPVGGGERFLIVATYPMKNAFKVTRDASAKSDRTVRLNLPDGGIAAYARGSATNVYVAYPGVDVQVEVYDPDAGARPNLVASGQIVPVR